MPTPKFTREILLAALAGFQLDKQRIDAQIAEVQAMLDGGELPATSVFGETSVKGTRKKFSAAARRKMALAQKARWAKLKGESEPPSKPGAPKAKRKISAAGRKAMSDATKRRWALKKAAEPAKSAPATKASKKAALKKATAKSVRKTVNKTAKKSNAAAVTAQAAS